MTNQVSPNLVDVAFNEHTIHIDPDMYAPNSVFVLVKRQAYRIPETARNLIVVFGIAWVSFGGADKILRQGESMELPLGTNDAIVSAATKEPAMIEIEMH
jgi:hypothetical protein